MKIGMILTILSLSFLLSSANFGEENPEACKSIKDSRVKEPCALSLEVETMAPCLKKGRRINDEEDCKTITSCCWKSVGEPRCFSKPIKCYVDLRREKCFGLRSRTGINGIYTGYSVNGSFCFIPALPSAPEELGFVENLGFPIHNLQTNTQTCLATWELFVRTQSNGSCEIEVINPSNMILPGTMYYNKACVYMQKFPFYFENNENITKSCTCTSDAWLQEENEGISVSDDVKKYIESKEETTCTQILGTITRLSWRNRISLVNKQEVNIVMNVLTNLTRPERGKSLTTHDAKAFLNSTRKVAQYPFFEGFDENSAKDLIKKTTSVLNNLIEYTQPVRVTPRREASTSWKGHVADSHVDEVEDMDEESSNIKQDVFDTLDTMSEKVASRIVPEKNNKEITFRAVEEHVDLLMTVTQPDNVKGLLERSHFSGSNKTKTDFLTVLDINLPKQEATNTKDDSVTLISIFYDYPTTLNDYRVSKYLSVKVREYVNGEAKKISVPVNFTLIRDDSGDNWNKSGIPTCSFLGPNKRKEVWLSYGCTTTNYPNSKTSCHCNHTTNFAVLMKFTESQLPANHSRALEIISVILGAISIAFLSVTLLVFIKYRETLLKDRMKIHFHLIVALLLAYLFLLISAIFASPDAKVPTVPCVASAILIHFFFLAVFFWSLVEGLYLFYKIVLVFERRWAECLPSYSPIIGWLTPLIIVAISFGMSRTTLNTGSAKDSYVDSTACFLTTRNGMIWAFAGPVLVIISVNLIVLLKVMYVIFKSSYRSIRLASVTKSTRVSKSLRDSARGALILMPILGLPTVVSLLYNFYTKDLEGSDKAEDKAKMVVGTMGAYLQVILAGVQGIMIFVFYCFFNAEVRSAYNLEAKRRKSVGTLEASLGTRKRSRLPLLSGREDGQTDAKTSLDLTKLRRNESANSQTLKN